jgi:hypothetical protein
MRLSYVSIALQIASLQFAAVNVNAFSSHRHPTASLVRPAPLLRETHFLATSLTASEGDAISTTGSSAEEELSLAEKKKKETWAVIRKEGGPFTFNTKFGALNPYAIYYGLTAIILGIPWFAAMTMCQLFYFVTRNRLDKNRWIPIRMTQVWGTTLLTLTRNWPKTENRDVLKKFYKEYVVYWSHLSCRCRCVPPFSNFRRVARTHSNYHFCIALTLSQEATSHVCSQSQLLDGHPLLGRHGWMEKLQARF